MLLMATSPVPAEVGAAIPQLPAQTRKKLVVRVDHRTGKLVTEAIRVAPSSVSTTPRPAAKPPAYIAKIVDDAAAANHVDPLLVHAVIQVESNYDAFAVSRVGARGLMQLMPPTARDLGVSNSFDPKQNIEAGVRYLKQLKDLYQDDRLALAAYNAGPAAVQKYKQQVPPYPETQAYVERVGQKYSQARKAAAVTPTVAVEVPAQGNGPEEVQAQALAVNATAGSTEETHPKLEQFVDEQGRLHLRTTPR
jgi:soluble lytic murein transglycosylase-like protein